MVKINVAANRTQSYGAFGIVIFPALVQDLVGAFETGQRLSELGADLNHLHDGRDQEAKKEGVGKESADGQHARRRSGGRRHT